MQDHDAMRDRVFRLTLTNGTERVILANSWNASDNDGTIAFRDARDNIVASLALGLVDTMYLLNDGPFIWTDGQSVDIAG